MKKVYRLRIYKYFKNEYKTKRYVRFLMPKAYSKFRCGSVPIKQQTGFYPSIRGRDCFHFFLHVVENKERVLLNCLIYNSIIEEYFEKFCIQSNFVGSNIFGTMEICSRHG